MSHNEMFAGRVALVSEFPSRTNADLQNVESGSFFQQKAAEITATLPPLSFFENRVLRHKIAVARDAAKKSARRNRRFVWERNGGIRFWKIGRFGGTFYIAKK